MSSVNIQVKDIVNRLNKMSYDIGVEINKKTILKKAGKVVLEKLRTNAPVDTGNLRDAQAFINRPKDKTGVLVGARYFSSTNSDGERKNAIAPHSHLIEFGWIDRGGNRHEGKPFVKQTYEQTKNQVVTNLISEVDKLEKKLEKKYSV